MQVEVQRVSDELFACGIQVREHMVKVVLLLLADRHSGILNLVERAQAEHVDQLPEGIGRDLLRHVSDVCG